MLLYVLLGLIIMVVTVVTQAFGSNFWLIKYHALEKELSLREFGKKKGACGPFAAMANCKAN
jgi:hypothetical protein